MLQLGNWTCAHSLTINYYVGKTQKKLLKNSVLAMTRNTTPWTLFLFFFFYGVSLCSIVRRRQQKNTKLLKTNTKKCNNYKSKVKISNNV